MQVKIIPGKISGSVSVPASKSLTHRAIMIASIAHGTSVIKNYLQSEDTDFTVKACRLLGAKIEKKENQLTIEGVGGKISLKGKTIRLFVGESGTSLRFLTALSTLAEGTVIIDGKEKLRKRPLGDLINVLRNQGIAVRSLNANDCAPVEIRGGKIRGGKIRVVSDKSSQFASAVLLIAPFAENDVVLEPVNLKSSHYLNLTWMMMKNFGIKGEFDGKRFKIPSGQNYHTRELTIEGDWSSASYFLVAAAVTGGKIKISNLDPESSQGDRKIVSLLSKMGCRININSGSLEIEGGKLNPITVDLGDNPDLVPSLSVAAAFALGKSTFTNVGHLIYKESNRLESVCEGLKKIGIEADFDENQITVCGGKPHGAVIDPHNDHRIAMSFAAAALGASGKTIIEKSEVVKKSYPDFFSDLKNLGANII